MSQHRLCCYCAQHLGDASGTTITIEGETRMNGRLYRPVVHAHEHCADERAGELCYVFDGRRNLHMVTLPRAPTFDLGPRRYNDAMAAHVIHVCDECGDLDPDDDIEAVVLDSRYVCTECGV